MTTKRLFPSIQPIHYNLQFTPDLETFTFKGDETFQFRLANSTDTITLHAHEIEVQTVQLVESNQTLVPKISYNKEEKTITFQFSQQLPSGEHTLTISYTGLLGERMKGFYRSSYEVNGEKRFLATTQLEEIGARQAFIGVDEPEAKAVFEVRLIVPEHLTAVSNTNSISQEVQGKFKAVVFAPTPKMSSYLLALIVGEFDILEGKTDRGIAIRILTTPEKKHLATFALSTAEKMLSFYEQYFGIPYPLPKLDFIAIPDFDAGAMENWGAITARESALLVDEEKSSAVSKQYVATVIAHEISHMWFGNLVTMEWWTYLWLNEGFASYMEYMAVDALFPEWKVWEQFAMLDHNRALGLDSLKSTHPIESEVVEVEKLKELFDAISYSKGASVIAMLAEFLGKDVFEKGIQAYLKKYAYQNATSDDLWAALEEVSGKPIKDIMHVFVSEPGHPVLKVSREDRSVHLAQERFFINPSQKDSSAQRWPIPLPILCEDGSEQSIVLSEPTVTVPAGKGWTKVNKNETSFVRSIYDRDLYQLLKQPIANKSFSAIDRMGIIRDAFDGAEGAYLSTDFALDMVKSYQDEDSYIVWATLLGKLGKVENIVGGSVLDESFKMFAKNLLNPIAARVGWEKKSSDSHSDVLLRSVILYWAGHVGNQSTIQKARQLLADFTQKGTPIDNDIRGLVYRLVAEHGGEKEFDMFAQMYEKETLNEEKNRISNALSSFQDAELVKKSLEFAISGAVRLQDIGRFFLLGFDNQKGREVTWEFLKTHWDKLSQMHKGQHGLSWLIEGAGSVVSEALKKDFEDFFATHPTPQLTLTIQQVLEQIDSNLRWVRRDREKIALFLQKH